MAAQIHTFADQIVEYFDVAKRDSERECGLPKENSHKFPDLCS